MPWILDTEKDLVNLDACETIYVAIGEPDEPWAVMASRSPHDRDGTSTLFEGPEAACRLFLKNLTGKLHVLKAYPSET